MKRVVCRIALSVATMTAAGCCGSPLGKDCQMPNIVKVIDAQSRPVAGVPVAVQDSGGALLQEAMTDPRGEARMIIPSNGQVSVYDKTGTTQRLSVIVAPPAEKDLTIRTSVTKVNSPTGSSTYELTLDSVPGGTRQIAAIGGCSSAVTSTDLTRISVQACDRNGKNNLLVFALDPNGQPLGWGALLDMPAAGGATTRKPLPLDRSDFFTLDASINGLFTDPAADSGVSIDSSGARERELRNLPGTGAGVRGAGSLRAQLRLPAPLVGGQLAVHVMTQLVSPPTGGYGIVRTKTREELVAANGTRQSFASDLSGVAEMTFGPPDTSTPGRPRWRWTSTATPTRGLGMMMGSIQDGSNNTELQMFFPVGSLQSLTLPVAPSTAASFVPTAAASQRSGTLIYVDGAGDYGTVLDLVSSNTAPMGYTAAYVGYYRQ